MSDVLVPARRVNNPSKFHLHCPALYRSDHLRCSLPSLASFGLVFSPYTSSCHVQSIQNLQPNHFSPDASKRSGRRYRPTQHFISQNVVRSISQSGHGLWFNSKPDVCRTCSSLTRFSQTKRQPSASARHPNKELLLFAFYTATGYFYNRLSYISATFQNPSLQVWLVLSTLYSR